MINDPKLTAAPTRSETRLGLIWLLFTNMLMGTVLALLNTLLPRPLSVGMLNFIYFCVNFCVCIAIFHKFLRENLAAALDRLLPVVWYAVLAYLGYQVLTDLLTTLICMAVPDFGNVNDSNLQDMMAQDLVPLGIGTVLLVPLAEETLHRGLIFRTLYNRHPVAAYIVSIVVFATIHVVGYIGSYPPLTLLLCFLQYLPAGYCLCWCYKRTGTIISPILMHTIVNATAIYYYLR